MKKIHLHGAIALLVGGAVFLLFLNASNFYGGFIAIVATCLSAIAIGILDIKRYGVTIDNMLMVIPMSAYLVGVIWFVLKLW